MEIDAYTLRKWFEIFHVKDGSIEVYIGSLHGRILYV